MAHEDRHHSHHGTGASEPFGAERDANRRDPWHDEADGGQRTRYSPQSSYDGDYRTESRRYGYDAGVAGYADSWRSEGEPDQRSGHHRHDPHYRAWRQRQMEQFDAEYQEYRKERQDAFDRDFEEWRAKRSKKNADDQST